ncbi:hypothetical protein S83_069814, partial [Arachis hypogaea]
GFLGALDGTYIEVTVPESKKARYRTRKGNYYLVDASYTNDPGFLAPYRGTRYHIRDLAQGARALRNYQEYFNR